MTITQQSNYYWVKLSNTWTIAKKCGDGMWIAIGSINIFHDEDFTEIGPVIPKPYK
jgi:hypothetical protein